ncbi:MAG: amidohydrolase family protein [Oscillospiraceae bacterium]|jgi:imidazolonepropionase-like amidohydrolase|nr:amidohydrolase family protein [Oscillospiraceae bacterium]
MSRKFKPEVLSDGYIKIEGKTIVDMGQMHSINSSHLYDSEIIDAKGCDAYPGFIDSHTHLGMFTNGESYEYSDANETSAVLTPNLRAIDSVNSFDTSFKEALHSGITSAVISPGSSNPIAGKILAVKTYGHRIDDMVIKDPVAIKFSLGENPKNSSGYIDDTRNCKTRMGIACCIREMLFKSKVYLKSKSKKNFDYNDYDDKYEALIPLLKGEISAHFHAHRADDIFTAIRICKEFGIKCVIVHGTEAYKIAGDLFKENMDILLGPLICDRSKPELINMNIKSISEIAKSGIKTSITTDHPVTPIQYLNIYAGLAVANGMDRMEAIRSITINPAEICAVDDRVGSLEAGKDADILIFEKDPFIIGNTPKFVICSGEIVNNFIAKTI